MLSLIAGAPDHPLTVELAADEFPMPLLLNADPAPDDAAIIPRCEKFAASLPGGTDGVIITLLPHAPPGLADFARHRAAAVLWAFTRQAALAWAPRRIRVNAIGLGCAPFGPFEPDDQAGRAATDPMPAPPASLADIAATVRAIMNLPSMTGQIVRLGA